MLNKDNKKSQQSLGVRWLVTTKLKIWNKKNDNCKYKSHPKYFLKYQKLGNTTQSTKHPRASI